MLTHVESVNTRALKAKLRWNDVTVLGRRDEVLGSIVDSQRFITPRKGSTFIIL